MALETRKVPAEIVIRFSPHPSRGKVGTPLTWMLREALETTDDGEQIGYKELNPRDLTREEAITYLGEQHADFADGTAAERAKAAADLQAEKAARAEAEKAKDEAHAAAITALQETADKSRQELQAAREVAIKAKDEAHATALAAQKAASDQRIADLEAKVSEQQTYIEAVCDLPKAKEMVAEAEAAKKAERRKALEAELATLTATDKPTEAETVNAG
jgi:translation initiation factor IF-2